VKSIPKDRIPNDTPLPPHFLQGDGNCDKRNLENHPRERDTNDVMCGHTDEQFVKYRAEGEDHDAGTLIGPSAPKEGCVDVATHKVVYGFVPCLMGKKVSSDLSFFFRMIRRDRPTFQYVPTEQEFHQLDFSRSGVNICMLLRCKKQASKGL